MKNISFPTTIVDGFFEKPDEVRKYALSLEYDLIHNTYPGKRTKSLNELNYNLFSLICNKFMYMFFDEFSYTAKMHFQKINKDYATGWVHKDNPEVLTAIIYLNPNVTNLRTGTSLYSKKDIFFDSSKHINSFNKTKTEGIEKLRNKKYEDVEEYTSAIKQHNSNFDESLFVRGIYNRAFLFDSHLLHAAENFFGEEDEERLTLVVFFSSITTKCYPIQKMQKFAPIDF